MGVLSYAELVFTAFSARSLNRPALGLSSDDAYMFVPIHAKALLSAVVRASVAYQSQALLTNRTMQLQSLNVNTTPKLRSEAIAFAPSTYNSSHNSATPLTAFAVRRPNRPQISSRARRAEALSGEVRLKHPDRHSDRDRDSSENDTYQSNNPCIGHHDQKEKHNGRKREKL